ncbi:MAG TPA: protein translocase subunit SecF [Verrucomicrobiae bacterium]|nr:protein translocase subunit SecF [Bryobacteraceae bacterium]HXU20026.1 protein translocase subunit SecF [Verrucomicrobiae bacterium]
MQIFENTNFDFLGKKWPFIILSLILTAAGLVSLALKGGPRYGIDFRGGALMYVRFSQKPPVEKIRAALDKKLTVDVQEEVGHNEVIIGTELASNEQLNTARQIMAQVLESTFGNADGKLDINNTGAQALADRLRDPLQRANVPISEQQLQDLTKNILNYRDTPPRSGLIAKLDDLASVPGVTPQIVNVLKQETWPAQFAVRDTEIVGPKIGADLRHQAILATLYALGGMLVYVAFRFEWIYGVAAVVAVFHDTIITIGLFSIFDKEISLTVIAALLTLVGYSMNDTIVVFDRIRENLKILRRETLTNLINKSINQTLSRTVLTSGLTFLTAVSLYLFGGQVLNGFSFCLVVGIVIGTYSSIYIASPILVWSQNIAERRKRPSAAPAKTQREEVRRGAAKVK